LWTASFKEFFALAIAALCELAAARSSPWDWPDDARAARRGY
jgi:hypothetical protein